MPPGSRRAHTKSRNGCGQCKRRKIKCDEQAPRCYNCTKWSVKCEFENRDESASTTVIEVARKRQPRSSYKSPSPSAQASTTLILSPPSVNLPHMELMHHYLTVTSLTLERPGVAGKRWNTTVPNEALRYEFLMHAVLGISALHMAHLRGTSPGNTEYLTRARGHQDEALTRFRTSVINITPENCTAAFLFSSTLLTFSMALTQAVGLPSQDPIDDMVVLLKSFRSHWKLFFSAQEWIEAGPLGQFLPSHFESTHVSSDLIEDDNARIALEELYSFNARTSSDDTGAQLYCNTILHLQKALHQGASIERLLWPIIISEAFVELLSHRMPMALIIMAHGCALAKHGTERWFMQDWISKVVHNIAMTIGETWAERMKWPLSELGVVISRGESNIES